MRKWFNEVGKLKCHSILLHTRKSRISVKVIFSPKQTADKDYLLLAAWKNVNSFLTVKMIFGTLGDNLWVAWPAEGCKCFCLTWECIFTTKYCLQQSSIAANTASHVAQGQCSTLAASHAGTHFLQFAPEHDESGLQIVWVSRSYDQVWRVSRFGSRWQGSDWTLIRSWLATLRRRRTRAATETRPSCRQD